MELLISGAASGVGRFLHERLGGLGLTRANATALIDRRRQRGVDAIIHCAFNSSKNVHLDALPGYLDDNISLTARLAQIPHRKFIYFSTVDIYPAGSRADEDAEIDPGSLVGVYAMTKLASEALVRSRCPNHLVLRPTSLLGQHCRPSTVIRLIRGQRGRQFLHGDSRYNFVLHSDLLGFIEAALRDDLQGVFNAATSGTIRLSEIAAVLGATVAFGSHRYDVGEIPNARICRLYPAFGVDTRQTLLRYIEEHHRG